MCIITQIEMPSISGMSDEGKEKKEKEKKEKKERSQEGKMIYIGIIFYC